MKPPFTFVNDSISHDSVEALKSLLVDAEKGDLIGIVFAGMYKQRKYIVNTTGEAYRNPTFALGMTEVLSDYLMQQVSK